MTRETFEEALSLVLGCGQDHCFLHNFGEPLLHPDLVHFVQRCCSRGVTPSFFTNGIALSEGLARDLVDAGLRQLWVSEHRRGELARVERLVADLALPLLVVDSFAPRSGVLHDWAGQVATRSTTGEGRGASAWRPCIFERQDAAVILWDGSVNVCCIDVNGTGVAGTVHDYLADPARYRFRSIPLCDGCTLMRGEEDL